MHGTAAPEAEPAALRPDAQAALERALELIAARSPEIACPILDRALAAGTITAAERAELLHEIVGAPAPPRSSLGAAAQRLRSQIRATIARAAPGLARPLLDEAVAARRLTPSQEMRILHRLGRGQLRSVSFST
ncbi:MAG: hypothetical protein ABSC56_11520 [Solirubrobacteraceae bacterium]|jgi:hypothetical protein